MLGTRNTFDRLSRNRQGSIAILAAAAAPLMVLTLALGLDFGNLTLQRRALQKDADLASIVATSEINDAENAVLQHFRSNGRDFAVRDGGNLLTLDGKVKFTDQAAFNDRSGYAELVKGRYTPDPTVEPDKRFMAGATPYDAVKVTIREKPDLLFTSFFTSAPQLYVVGTSSSDKLAAFSIGSRLASLDGGLINSLLGGLLGTKLSLSVMDYNALLDADVNVLYLADSLGADLGLTAGTYNDVLKTKITYKQFLAALFKTKGIAPNAATVIVQLQQALNKTQINFALQDIVNLNPFRHKIVGTGDTLRVSASIFDLVTASANAANAGKQVALDLGATVPGLASTKLAVAIGEPPVGTPMLAVGSQGSIVRTSQTRASLIVTVDGLAAIAGLRVQLPIYINLANAEAQLSGITCLGGTKANAGVAIAAVPGVAELALGTLDDTAFANFGTTPRVTKAAIVSSSLLKVNAMGHIDATNVSPKTLTFSPSDIASGSMKSVSTRDTLTTLVSSLLGNLDLDVNILLLTIGTPKAVTSALADTLSKATVPIDTVLYNTLLVLGVKIGEADIRVTGVACQRPVLVN